jgi:phenylalanyl-tRNA synthetase beta chain
MKLSRRWLSDYIDLSNLADDELVRRLTDIGHALEALEKQGDDTVFDLEITTNRVDAMSHLGMARELSAALGRELIAPRTPRSLANARDDKAVKIRVEAPHMCRRYTALAIRGVTIKPSPPAVQRRLEAVGLRPINNVVDATNYAMLSLGHPLHAFDLDKLAEATIIVRAGNRGEKIKSLDGETRAIDPQTVVIADARRPVALGGIIGGFDSEITNGTRNVLLECAWFEPAVIRRTARRLGLKTDASYRFERGVDPNDTVAASLLAAKLIVESGGGNAEAPIDIVAVETKPETARLRTTKLREASGGVIGIDFAIELFRRMQFGVRRTTDEIEVTVPTYRRDIHEEMDLVEEVLRFYGLNNVPAALPRLTTGDVRREPGDVLEDQLRQILVGCGLSEAINYAFIRPQYNALFTGEKPVTVTNALSENVSAMRLSLLPGLLDTVVFNRSYGTRDGAFFEVGRTYHRQGERVREHRRLALVMFGSIGSHWGEAKRPVDFFDVKGVVEQIGDALHVPLTFAPSEEPWLRTGRRAGVWLANRTLAGVGFLTSEILQTFGIKGDVAAVEIDVEALLQSIGDWKMQPVPRFPGVPMILAVTHAPDLQYQRLIETIRSFAVPYLHEVGLRDRFLPEGEKNVVKTTLGMWYQAFDRSLTQEEVSALQQQLAARLTQTLPVRLVS